MIRCATLARRSAAPSLGLHVFYCFTAGSRKLSACPRGMTAGRDGCDFVAAGYCTPLIRILSRRGGSWTRLGCTSGGVTKFRAIELV